MHKQLERLTLIFMSQQLFESSLVDQPTSNDMSKKLTRIELIADLRTQDEH